MKDIRRVLVAGAGTMGHGFAQVMATKGLDVILADEREEQVRRARAWIADSLEYLAEAGELDPAHVPAVLSRIEFSTELEDAARKVDYVLEAVYENLELKKRLFQVLSGCTGPEIVLATNTSSFDINELSAVSRHPERVIGTHWFHPPQITPCVEIIPADPTSRETVEHTCAFMERIGKFPTLCRSAPGFVANRIQFAMAAEAYAIVEEGLATPEQIDRIVKSSFGFRLGAYGPCEIADQAGIDTYIAIFEYLHDKLGREQFKPPEILKKLAGEKRCGLKTGAGFYDYPEGAAEAVKRERDGRLYSRLLLFRDEMNRAGRK